VSDPQQTEGVALISAESQSLVEEARALFLEYAQSLGFSLCFQSFDEELAGLPGGYAPPDGRLLLAKADEGWAGCVALHKLAPDICEMKRLYVRPQFRGRKIGKLLAERVITDARQIGYSKMRLDTVAPVMKDAVRVYRKMGFYEIPAYTHNPQAGVLYMEKELQ
jgi:GNAT superfamily N-acetyltransferase